MKVVRVKKADVLERLKANRAMHRKIVEEAHEGFKVKALAALEAKLASFKAGKGASLYLHLETPEDHTQDYDAVIDMLEMEVADEVEISHDDFRRYVRDEWQWRQQFLSHNSAYSDTASQTLGG